jgi:hypothetical protein
MSTTFFSLVGRMGRRFRSDWDFLFLFTTHYDFPISSGYDAQNSSNDEDGGI